MGKYIPLDAVVAEIERVLHFNNNWIEGDKRWQKRTNGISSAYYKRIGSKHTCESFLDFVNTLEVKEINLEDSIKETLAQKYIDYTCKRHNIDPDSRVGQLIYYAYMHGMNQCLNQLKAQKGE